MRNSLGCWSCALLLVAGEARAADSPPTVPAVTLEVACPESEAKVYGSGFIVEDGTAPADADPRPLLLLTALHVIHECSSVVVYVVDCHAKAAPGADAGNFLLPLWLAGGSTASAATRTWPNYDLAAIEIPPESRARFSAMTPGTIRWGASPEPGSHVWILGRSQFAACPLIPARS